MFKGLGNLTGMLQQAREMQERMANIKEKIAALKVEGVAGGGMVRCEAAGDQRILSIKIDPTLLDAPDAEMLEDLVTVAVNQALTKARDTAAEEMANVTQAINVPGLQEALAKFGVGDQS